MDKNYNVLANEIEQVSMHAVKFVLDLKLLQPTASQLTIYIQLE